MKIVLALGLAATTCAAFAQDGWKSPKTILANMVERYGDQPERKLSLLQSDGTVAYKTDAAIVGELSGIPRIEAIGPQGVLTWIDGKPLHVLQLIAPTTPEMLECFDRPRFSRADLEFNYQGIEKALNKKVYVGKSEAVAGRDCLVLRVADKIETASTDYQKLWIDRETGLTMKQEDWFAGKLTYSRTVTSVLFKNTEESEKFAPAPNAVVIRGLVSPVALLKHANLGSFSDFDTDISKINANAKPAAWASSFDASLDMGYMQTTSRDMLVQTVAYGQNASQNNQNRNNRGRRQNQFRSRATEDLVFLRSGASDNVAAVRTFQVEITNDDGGGPRRTFQIVQGAEGSVEASPSGQGGTANQNATTGSKSYPFAQSDFIDTKTGETLSFLQIKGRPVMSLLSALAMKSGDKIEDKRLDSPRLFAAVKPWAGNVLVWKRGDVEYALVSTKLSGAQLVEIAAKVRQQR
jgi:hypothetical protein